MKMVSVYRDTYLQYTVNDINYGKATSALFFGGILQQLIWLIKFRFKYKRLCSNKL